MVASEFVRQIKDLISINDEVITKMPIKVILKSYIGYNIVQVKKELFT